MWLEIFFFLLIQLSLYGTQIKVNILEKEFPLLTGGLWLETSLKGFTWKAMKTSATDPEVLNGSEMQGHS